MTIIGIDLGTTNSLACVYKESGPELIPNAYGSFFTPSVVAVKDGDIIVGLPAKEILINHPENATSLFKRKMGDIESIKIANKSFTPEELSSFIISSLIKDAERYLNEKVDEVVISVPAYFYDEQRFATKKAGILSDVRCERIINEPSAAALASYYKESTEEAILVFDFGGGTLDVSIVDCIGNAVSVVSIAGDNVLGGSDFDHLMADSVLKEHHISKESISRISYEKLLLACEICKKNLSDNEISEIDIDYPDLNIKSIYDNKRLAEEARELLIKIKLVIERALNDSFMSVNDIKKVIMIGGSSKMPLIQSYIKYLFKKSPLVRDNCDEMVAYGVGLFCGIKQRMPGIKQYILSDVCPFSLCTGTYNRNNPNRNLSTVIIPRNSILPISISDTFYTVRDNQEVVDVSVLQGELPYEDQNKFLDELRIGVPKNKAGKESIKIRFTYDINGILIVEVESTSTKEKKTKIISQHLSDEEVEKAIEELEKYKVDYREQEINKSLLLKLEKLVEENIEGYRDYYMNLLQYFESALNTQNIYRIEKARLTILDLLETNKRNDNFGTVDSFLDDIESDDDDEYDEWEIFDKWVN